MSKVVIITGGGGAIGRAVAKVFAANEYTCVLIDVHEQNAKDATRELGSGGAHRYMVADVSRPAQIEGLVADVVKTEARIDVLVNLAASNRGSFTANDDLEERWDKTIENDLKSVYLLSERVVVEMATAGGGSIVNLGSIAGGFLGSHSLPYSAAKAGIVAITKSHARIYGLHNIRCNCIVPGIIDTSMVRDSVAQKEDGYFDRIRESTPLRRWGRPDEIAEAVYFVGSEKCSFMTGATIIIDGGATLTLGPRVDESLPFKWDKFTPKTASVAKR